jgi:hypothetical protein
MSFRGAALVVVRWVAVSSPPVIARKTGNVPSGLITMKSVTIRRAVPGTCVSFPLAAFGATAASEIVDWQQRSQCAGQR